MALMLPLQDTARNTAGALVIIAATMTSIVVLWGLVIRAGKTRPGRWFGRRIMRPLRRVFIDERRDQRRAEANARILKVVEQAIAPMIAPLATKIEEIAHATEPSRTGDQKTMSAEITALTVAVKQITDDLAATKVVAALVTELAVRVAALEGKTNEPHPPAATPNPTPHRRHDDL